MAVLRYLALTTSAGIVPAISFGLSLPVPLVLYGVIGFVAMALAIFLWSQSRWEQAEPNEWLLLIENGQLKRAGIGLQCFRGLTQSVVKMKSAIHKVNFNANHISKEMQGIIVKGMTIWEVDPEKDGPFDCYKYTQDGRADDNVKTMCESILRSALANLELTKIMTSRDELINYMHKDLQKQLSKWGIRCQTIEITEIRVCSKTVFEDMQAEFRQENRLKSTQIKLDTNEKMTMNQLEAELKNYKISWNSRLERETDQQKQDYNRREQELKIYEKNVEISKQKAIQEKNVRLKQMDEEHTIRVQEIKNENEQKLATAKEKIELRKQKLDIEKSMNETNMQKYQIDSTKKIIKNLRLKQLRFHNYVDAQKSTDMSNLLPSVGNIIKI